jgi:replication factor A1
LRLYSDILGSKFAFKWVNLCRYCEVFQAGRVYDISKGTLSTVRNPRFSSHQFEIRLDHNAVVEECADQAAAASIKRINYVFKKIAEVEAVAQGAMVDVVAVVHSVGDLNTIMKRDGGETSKRSVILRDDSGGGAHKLSAADPRL